MNVNKSFTLIELLIVIIIIGIVYFLALPSIHHSNPQIKITNLRNYIHNSTLYIFDDYSNNKKLNLDIDNIKVYDFNLQKKLFSKYKDKNIIFKYEVKNGIGDSFILECNKGIFVFKPLHIYKVNSLNEAKHFLDKYRPIKGSFY